MHRFAATDRDGWHDTALVDDTRDAIAALRALETSVHLMVAQLEARGITTTEGGAAGTAAWLDRETGLPRRRAQQLARTAKFLNRHVPTRAALAGDEISLDHVGAISAVVSTRRDRLYEEHEETVLRAARRLPIGDFSPVVRRWASLADDQLADSDAMTQHDGRRWHYAVGLGGTVTTDGFFDPAAGAMLITAIDALSAPDSANAPGGPRTPAQRRADALVELARRYLVADGRLDESDDECGSQRIAEGTAATVSVIVDFETLLGGDAPLEHARSDIDRVGPVPRSTIQRITCDSLLHRTVMDGQSQVIDMGRQRRLVTPTQRRALIVRDGGCIGCGRPASWCQAHHVDLWSHGGLTNLDKLVLVCPRCHTLVHEGGWSVVRTDDGRFRMVPTGRHPP